MVWQWLLGEGIRSVEELISDHNRSNMSSQMDKGTLEELKISPAFPLDPDMGRYCEQLASKPRLRNSAHAAEACAFAVIATRRSAAAMKRAGLSVSALSLVDSRVLKISGTMIIFWICKVPIGKFLSMSYVFVRRYL